MTKFKQYVREKGLQLECDFDTLPSNGIECCVVVPERRQVSYYHNGAGWVHWVFNRASNLVAVNGMTESMATRAAVYKLRKREVY